MKMLFKPRMDVEVILENNPLGEDPSSSSTSLSVEDTDTCVALVKGCHGLGISFEEIAIRVRNYLNCSRKARILGLVSEGLTLTVAHMEIQKATPSINIKLSQRITRTILDYCEKRQATENIFIVGQSVLGVFNDMKKAENFQDKVNDECRNSTYFIYEETIQ